jgi:hypothetical protein
MPRERGSFVSCQAFITPHTRKLIPVWFPHLLGAKKGFTTCMKVQYQATTRSSSVKTFAALRHRVMVNVHAVPRMS